MNELLRPKEVARILSVSCTTVHRLAARGRLPSIWIGGQRRFREEDVARLLDTGTAEARPPGRPRKLAL